MSRGTLGTFLGAGIGFLIGGPAGAQIGALIGGAVGSSFDTIQGRKVGEMASPRAQEGEPIPLTFGSARVTGRLMSAGEPEIRTETEGGKGGPKVENETAYLSYSILICESSELRDSSIAGILMVIENNKIVYDVRPNPAISASDSAKWKQNKVFYFGGESQGVDPTEQMIHGTGNAPAYRGIARMVVTDEDVTQHGGSIPTYEFVTTQCGVEEVSATGRILITGSGSTPFITAEATTSPTFVAIPTSTGADVAQAACSVNSDGVWIAVGASEVVYSTDILNAWSNVTPVHGTIGRFGCYGADGWLLQHRAAGHAGLIAQASSIPTDLSALTINIDGGATRDTLSMTAFTGGMYYASVGFESSQMLMASPTIGGTWDVITTDATSIPGGSGDGIRFFHDIVELDGVHYASVFVATGGGFATAVGQQVRSSTDDGATWPNLIVDGAADGTIPFQLCNGGGTLIVVDSDASAVYTSADGFAEPHATGISRTAEALPRNEVEGRHVAYANGLFFIMGDSALVTTTTGVTFSSPVSYPGTFNTPLSIAAYSAYEPPVGGIELPDIEDNYYDPETGEVSGPGYTVDDCPPVTLDEIIDKLDARAGIPPANSVTSALSAIEVPGYAIDQFMTVAEAKEPLRQVYFFDCPEYDDAIRYRLRGQATDFTVDPDDLIVGEEATEKGVRGQTVEFPKRLHVQYVDPATGYKPMKQTAERISPDIRVKGEVVAGANITLDADTAKQAADIGLRVAWTEREDSREIVLPMDYFADAIPAHTFSLDGRRYRITDMRVEAGAIYIDSKYDRISAYSSTASGNAGPSPNPGSSLSGPTVSAIMNLPVLRDDDDKAGIYWAASGVLSTWPGAQLQLSRNGSTFENGPKITQSATMGTLSASLASASRYGMDTTNTLSVTLTTTSGTLDSTDYDGLIEEANAAAILYADGTAEIIQFQTATETAPGEYDLTGLLRGRNDTVAGAHSAGAQFVLLNSAIRFVALRADDLGKTLTFRPVSLNTPAASNATQTLIPATLESLREWSPYNVTVESDGAGGYCVEWIGRGRLGTSRTPVHSQWLEGYRVTFTSEGNSYVVDTTDQAVCATSAELEAALVFGWPTVTVQARSRVATNDDDFSSDPATPTAPPPGAIGPGGAAADTTLGPNGGYADNTPYHIPEPTVFGANVVDGGTFSSAGDLGKWRDGSGNALDSRWSIVSGRLCFYGIGTATAYNWGRRVTLAQQLIPHYTFDVTGDVESDAGAKAAIGLGLGFSTAGGSLGGSQLGTPAEYGDVTSIAHSYEDSRDEYSATAGGQMVVTIAAPAVQAVVDGPVPARVYFDNIEMAITENAPATTPQTLTNLDFAAGLTGWVQFPPASGISPSPTVSGGEVTFTPVSEYGVHKYLICEDPITDLDTLNKWVKFAAEVNCNDPTVFSGITRGGVGLSYAIYDGASYNYTAWANLVERGDWTERTRWMRQILDTPGYTFHVCILFKCAVGYEASVRNISVDVTNAPVT